MTAAALLRPARTEEALLAGAVEKGVAYVPGTHFYADGEHANTLRLNFSMCEPDAICEGMHRLAAALK